MCVGAGYCRHQTESDMEFNIVAAYRNFEFQKVLDSDTDSDSHTETIQT